MAKPIQRMLHIVKTFQYLLHAIDFVNVFQMMERRARQCFSHRALRISGGQRTRVELALIAEVRIEGAKTRKGAAREDAALSKIS